MIRYSTIKGIRSLSKKLGVPLKRKRVASGEIYKGSADHYASHYSSKYDYKNMSYDDPRKDEVFDYYYISHTELIESLLKRIEILENKF